MTNQIFVIEGPAGAGKSYALMRLEQKGLAHVMSKKKQPRDFSGIGVYGPNHYAFINDVGKISRAWSAQEHINIPIMVDRFMISTFVYDVLRRPMGIWNLSEFKEYMEIQMNTLVSLNMMYRSRMEFTSRYTFTQLQFIIYLPGLRFIEERRSLSKNSYPFPLNQEYKIYSRIYDWYLRKFPNFIVCETIKEIETVVGNAG